MSFSPPLQLVRVGMLGKLAYESVTLSGAPSPIQVSPSSAHARPCDQTAATSATAVTLKPSWPSPTSVPNHHLSQTYSADSTRPLARLGRHPVLAAQQSAPNRRTVRHL